MYNVGLDLGRRNVKLYTGYEYIYFPAVVGEWRKLNLENRFGNKAFQGVFNDQPFFAGTLAERESEYARQMLIEDKATPDALLLALLALHQTGQTEFDVVTGLPVTSHTKENKEKLINLLEGSHKIEVNNKVYHVNINRVRVAVEGGGAFWSNPQDGLVRILDGGSKTFNYITLKNKHYVDRDSGTLPFGLDTNQNNDFSQLSARLAGDLGKKWSQYDHVYTVGGKAIELAHHLKQYFPKIQPLQQNNRALDQNNEPVDLNLFANAIGYYMIGGAVVSG